MPRDVRLIRSPLSVAGMVLTTVSAVVFLVVFLADLFGLHTNPYLGHRLLPGPAGVLFVFGLLLIPLGAWVERRRRAAGQAAIGRAAGRGSISTTRRSGERLSSSSLLTIANVVIVSLGAYRGVEYMDSVAVLRRRCATGVMKPEFVAHDDQPHARVTCVAVPRRTRRLVVREGQALRHAAGAGGDARHLLASDRGRAPTSCCPRATPASSATGRRSSTATRSAASSSTRTTRRTPSR